jgi:YesN/AraC family two-component response regulator
MRCIQAIKTRAISLFSDQKIRTLLVLIKGVFLNKQLKMVLINLNIASNHKGELPIGMEMYFDIERLDNPDKIASYISRKSLDVIGFEFDYPDRDSLSLMLDAKQSFPSIPMIMITLQHSEKLAVWAFRSRLADYLTKPIPQSEITRCHEMLTGMTQARAEQERRPINRIRSELPQEVALHVKTTDNSFRPAIYYVTENFNKKIEINEAANLCSISPYRFGREFKGTFGLSFRDYVVRYRLREAYRLLCNPNISITEAAISVGFSDPSYFGKLFKKHFGVSPTEKFSNLESNNDEYASPTAQLKLPEDLIEDCAI